MTNDVADVVAFIRLCGDRLSAREVCKNACACSDLDNDGYLTHLAPRLWRFPLDW